MATPLAIPIATVAQRKITLTTLTVTAILGVGVKLGSVSVLDELGLAVFFLGYLLSGTPSVKLHDVNNLCLAYFAFIYLIGFLSSGNINALRYAVMAFLIIVAVNVPHLDSPSKRAIEIASYLFIILTIVLPVVGLIASYEEAWWQDWVWSGTAYAAYGTFISASLLVWYGGIGRCLIVACLVIASGVLNDSRTTILLSVLLVFPLVRVFKRTVGNVHRLKLMYVIMTTIVLLFVLVLIWQFLGAENDSELMSVTERVVGVTWQTVENLISGDTEQDLDRQLSNKVALDLMDENIFRFLFGAGGFSHQYDLLDRGLSYSGTKVRPTGVPAVIFDGGVMFMALILLSAFSASWMALKSRVDVLGKIFLSIIPIASVLMLFITNMLDCTLFWLVLRPGFLSKMFSLSAPRESISVISVPQGRSAKTAAR